MSLFLYGENTYLSLEELEKLKMEFSKDNLGSSLSIFDFDEGNGKLGDFFDAINSGGLFSSKKMIIVKNLLMADREIKGEVFEFLNERKKLIESDDMVMIFWEKENKFEKESLFEFVTKNFEQKKFKELSGKEIPEWIQEKIQVSETKTSISNDAVNELIAFVGSDMFRLSNEISKLIGFKAGEKIEKKDVDILVKSKIEANIFATIDALGFGKKGLALELLHKQLEKGDDPFYILSMYVYQFRNLLKIGSIYWQGTTNEKTIAQEAKLHPFVVRKGISQIRNFSFDALRKTYRRLQDIDVKIKTGKLDIELGLDKFIAEI